METIYLDLRPRLLAIKEDSSILVPAPRVHAVCVKTRSFREEPAPKATEVATKRIKLSQRVQDQAEASHRSRGDGRDGNVALYGRTDHVNRDAALCKDRIVFSKSEYDRGFSGRDCATCGCHQEDEAGSGEREHDGNLDNLKVKSCELWELWRERKTCLFF